MMRWLRKGLIWLLVLITGCTEQSANRPVLELWLADWNEDTRKLFLERLIPEFEKRYGIGVHIQFLSWQTLDEKMTIAFAGGVSPDVFQVGAEYVGGIAYRGQARILDDRVAKWGQQPDFYEASWRTCVYRGHVYGLPYLSAPRCLIYRKDLLQQAGYSRPPRTWDELVEVAQKLTLREGNTYRRAGMNLPVSWQTFLEFLWQNGGDVVSPDGREVYLDRPEAIEALQFYSDLYNRYQVCPTAGLPTVGGGVPFFAAGVSAMEINNQFAVYNVNKYAPEIKPVMGVTLPPYRRKPTVSVYTDWLAMSSQTKQPDAAWKLMIFLMEPANLEAYNATMFFVPPRKSLKHAEFIRRNPELKIYAEMMERYGRSLPPIPAWFEIRDGLRSAVESAIYGKKTPEQALRDYANELRALLKEYQVAGSRGAG